MNKHCRGKKKKKKDIKKAAINQKTQMFKAKFSNVSEHISCPSTKEHVWKCNICRHRSGTRVGKCIPYHLEITNASPSVLNFTKADFLSPPILFATLTAKEKP